MRARQRHFIAALFAAVAVALAQAAVPSPGDTQIQAHECARGTSWDNRLQRCV